MTDDLAHRDPHRAPAPEDAYRRLLEAMPVMLWTADPTGHWTHVNGAWTRYTGVIGDVPGFGFETALHPEDRAPTVAAWRGSVERAQDYQIQYRLRRRDGVYRWFLIRGVRVADAAGRDMAWVGTCTDIDEQKQAEQQALDAREAAVRALGLALEARDHVSKGHTDRVTDLAGRLGAALQLDPADRTALRLGAYLHDVGKIAIPDAILLKPGPLSEAEWQVMRGHVLEGERLASTLGVVPPAALALIRNHHERWDGSGYPDGLRREAIPLLARIFAVVDVYDALCSARPYKQPWTARQVAAALRAEAGRQLDPDVVAAFLRVLYPPDHPT